jgi:hypothetical protein
MDCPISLLPASLNLYPLQHPFAPGIHEAHNQDEDKDDSLQNGKQPQLTQFHSPGEEKDRFHIEDQKHQGKNIILGLELDPTLAHGLDTTLISCLFNGIGFLRP